VTARSVECRAQDSVGRQFRRTHGGPPRFNPRRADEGPASSAAVEQNRTQETPPYPDFRSKYGSSEANAISEGADLHRSLRFPRSPLEIHDPSQAPTPSCFAANAVQVGSLSTRLDLEDQGRRRQLRIPRKLIRAPRKPGHAHNHRSPERIQHTEVSRGVTGGRNRRAAGGLGRQRFRCVRRNCAVGGC
jgi:hypothetical protein